MSAFNPPTTPENALALLLGLIKPVGAEVVPLLEALGRVNYRDIAAVMDQPPFDRSALDGYALRAEDISSASQRAGVMLRVTQAVYAGDVPQYALCPGEAAQVTTGAQLPCGADCVVQQEDTSRENGLVYILRSPGKGKNIVFRNKELRQGERLARPGEMLDSAHLGLLAGQGFSEVQVYRKPRLGLLSTGNELTPAGQELLPGKIYDSNGPMLGARIQLLGGTAAIHRSVEDDSERIGGALSTLLQETDLVITTGGVAVGARDLLPQAGALLEAETLFHRLPYKPGGGVLALRKAGKLILCLSGNPFAACTAFELLAAPCLRKLAGAQDYQPCYLTGVLQQDFVKPNPVRRFVRAQIRNGSVFLNTSDHGAGSLSTLPGGNCLLDIPAGSGALRRGDPVQVVMFQGGPLT